MLLPLPSNYVNEMLLVAHLALAACRSANGNSYQLYELVRTTYLSYFMWQDGYGSAEYSLYCAAEQKLEEAAALADLTGEWRLDEGAAALIEVIVRIYDEQIGSVSVKSYMHNRAKLERVMRVEIPLASCAQGAGHCISHVHHEAYSKSGAPVTS
ncbi:hypothetical protein [Paraburkholderia phenoliruptrix]|nr:hypothetical protein [Paraburkholderia phenoliruptrix]